ncbi:MAG TPA: peptidase S10, partial [Phenylobacterium sp.]
GPPLPGSAEAVALEPALKILVAAGRYDSLASCTTNAEMERNLPSALKASMSFRCYEGGHMFYRDQPTRLQFSKDIRDLVAGR